MKKITRLNIDGHDVEVPEGTMLIEAAAKIGVNIPTLCYCPGLKSTGACRICLVELEGQKNLIVSCGREAKDGMVVKTNTPRVLEARRFIVDLLLSNHHGDCLSCDKSGACNLQEASYTMGIEKTSYPMKDFDYSVNDDNPFIERNYGLCVLCGRCVRICSLQGANILDFVNRGMATKISTAENKPLHESGCDFCGSCVSVCPVAALMERDRRFKGREWQIKTIETSCAYCGCGCSLALSIHNDQVLKSTSISLSDYICARGRFGWTYVESDERLTRPLIRKNGELVESSWEEAFSYISSHLLKIKENYGSNSIAGLIKATATNEEIYAFNWFFKDCIGTNNIDTSARLYGYLTLKSFFETFGNLKIIGGSDDIENAEVIFVIGADITIDYPHVGAMVKRALSKGAKLIVLDSKRTEISNVSESHIQPKPGSEGKVLSFLAKELIRLKKHNENFIHEKVKDFKKLEDSLKSIDEAEIIARYNINPEDIEQLAILLGDKKKKTVIIFPAELNDRLVIQMLKNIFLLTGKIKKSAIPCFLLSNLNGAFYFNSFTETLLKKTEAQKDKGLTALEIIESAGSTIKAMFIFGEDVLSYYPSGKLLKEKISALDLLVVQDVFLSETAKIADVVLPGTTFVETSGTRINFEHKLVKQRKATKPKVKDTFEIVNQLSNRMGYPTKLDSVAHLSKRIKEMWENLNKCEGKSYSFDLGVYETAFEEPDKKYPYLLMMGGSPLHFHDGQLTSRTKISLLEDSQNEFIGVSFDDARKLNLSNGSKVTVSSKSSSIECEVKLMESLPPGLIFAPRWNKSAYELFGREIESEFKTPKNRLIATSISKINSKEGEL